MSENSFFHETTGIHAVTTECIKYTLCHTCLHHTHCTLFGIHKSVMADGATLQTKRHNVGRIWTQARKARLTPHRYGLISTNRGC